MWRGISIGLTILMASSIVNAEPSSMSKSKLKRSGPTYYVVSIGVDKYSDSFWPDLRWAAKDAETIGRKIGKSTAYRRDITVLTDAKATKRNIKVALNRIASRARPGDVLLVYVSSHGTLMAGSSASLEPVVVLPTTSPAKLRETGLPQRELLELIEPIRAKQKLLMYATCHSGLGKSKLPDRVRERLAGAKGRVADLEKVSEGTIVLAAAAKGETAREDKNLGGDIYTHFFLEALNVYDRDKDGQVTALEAHDYAKERTYRFTKGRQRPTVKAELIGAGDIPVSGKRRQKGLPVLEGYDELYAGYEVRVNKGQKGRLPLAFPLNLGTSRVEVFAEGANKPMAVFNVDASKGETIQVQDLFETAPFAVGVFGVHKTFMDSKFEKIYGAENDTSLGLRLKGEWRGFNSTLFYVSPTEGGDDIWSGLESEVTQQYYGLTFGYRYDLWFGLGFGGHAVFGQDQSELTFKDTNTGSEVSEKSSPTFYGLGGQLQYRILSNLAIHHEIEYHWVDYEYGQFGEVSGDRFLGQVGVSYLFGAKARRVK